MSTLALTQPVAVLMLSVRHFISADDSPAELIPTYADRLHSGSYLGVSRAYGDDTSTPDAAAMYAQRFSGFWMRGHAQIA